MNTFDAPVSIRKYRLADLAAYPEYQATVEQLLGVLKNPLELTASAVVIDNHTVKQLPFLPVMRHRQTLYAAARYLETDMMRGIRYLTTYQPVIEPLTAEQIFYTFQGISRDREYYFAVTVLLSTPLFPENITSTEMKAFKAQGSAYWHKAVAKLNAAAPEDFNPSLTLTDSLVSSFRFVP